MDGEAPHHGVLPMRNRGACGASTWASRQMRTAKDVAYYMMARVVSRMVESCKLQVARRRIS